MAFCQTCGDIGYQEADICPHCGAAIVSDEPETFKHLDEMNQFKPHYGEAKPINPQLLFLIGFFIPVLGIIVGLILKDSKKASSDAIMAGAFTSFFLSFVIFVVLLLLGVIM